MPEGARSSRGRPSAAKKPSQGRVNGSGRAGEGRSPRRPDGERSGGRNVGDRRRKPDDAGSRRDSGERSDRRSAAKGGSRRTASEGDGRRGGAERDARRGSDERRSSRGGSDRRASRDGASRADHRADGRSDHRGARRSPRPEPRTEAEKRREAVRARGGGRARSGEATAPPERLPETWIDEGPVRRPRAPQDVGVRSAAKKAVRRSSSGDLDPTIRQDLEKSVPARRQSVLAERLRSAQISLERERFAEAKRVARSLLKEMGSVAAVHEVIGLASYRMGQWKDATAALEMARTLRFRIEDLPVLADCYRAQKRWQDLDDVWTEMKQHSPAQEILSEGRIVYAGSLADRGDLFGAIAVMMRSASAPRRIRDHHLRQWYVLADLYDRAGNVQKAREFFRRVSAVDPSFADVESRLAQL